MIEAINKLDGTPFNEDDLFLLNSIAETAASALNNAGLLQAERKVEILETLVKVSAEITSTLDLDRVLDAVVTGPGAVIPYERAAIALEERGRLKIRAITGMPRINPQDPNVARLQDILEWASLSNDEVSFSQHGEQFEDPARRRKPSSANISPRPVCAAFTPYLWPTMMAGSAHCRLKAAIRISSAPRTWR